MYDFNITEENVFVMYFHGGTWRPLPENHAFFNNEISTGNKLLLVDKVQYPHDPNFGFLSTDPC